MGSIIFAGLGISITFFRKGGIYNPSETVTTPTSPQPSPEPLSTPNPTITMSTPKIAPEAKIDPLTVFCTALMNFEGGPNDPNHINCNPGDFRCSPVGYLPKYGKVGCTPHGFAVFPTFALGWEYLLESVKARVHTHPNWTFLDFFTNFAPESDGNPTRIYAETIAKACGVPVDSKVSDYLSTIV